MAGVVKGQAVQDLSTPCFLLDVNKLEHNAKTMIQRCQDLGIRLRPHMKTAKTIEAGLLMTGGSRRRVCVSTLVEAEFFAEAGFDDIIYAMLICEDRMTRLKGLAERLDSFHVLVDNQAHIELLGSNPLSGNKSWSVYLAVDTGSAREGIQWNDANIIDLVTMITSGSQMTFAGLYTHEGNASYSVMGFQQVGQVSDATVDRILTVSKNLQEAGVECANISVGATPTASLPGRKIQQITEIHPGNYIFYDAQQMNIGSCSESDIACVVLTRVIGHYPHRSQLLVDAGWSAVSLDGKLPNGSYGMFRGQPNLRLIKMHQEYGFVSYDPDKHTVQDFPIGTMLFLYPYHSCATALLHKQHYVHKDNKIIDIWTPCTQW